MKRLSKQIGKGTRMSNFFFALCCIFATTLSAVPLQKSNATDEFDLLRIKWAGVLIGKEADPLDKYIAEKIRNITKDAQGYWTALNKGKEKTYLWPDLTSTKISAEITYAYRRIYSMALAYNTKGSSLKGDAFLRDDIICALEWMNANRYVNHYNDWWDFQIGAPLELNNCITLMYDDLSVTQRVQLNERVAKFSGNPMTDAGANRAWRAFVYGLNGILKKDSLKIAVSRNAQGAIFEYVTKGEGFFKDGSFIQHTNHPYNLGYGIDAIAKLSDLMFLLDGSAWKVTDTNSQNTYRWIYDSFEPFIYKGVAMDMVRGREMGRSFKQDYKAGFIMVGIVAKLAQFAPKQDAHQFKRMVKYWVSSNKQKNYFAHAAGEYNISINTIVQVQHILADTKISPRDELIFYRQYPMMDRALKLGAGFGFGISMHSNRIANYEADIKNENKKGWHTSDGMTYLYNADLNQFSNNFWPTVDNFRLPGTTVLQSTEIASDKISDRDWVGGVSLSNNFGVSGMDYHAIGYTLQAKKSWFMFDNEIVALGAGISAKDNKAVETIVENRKLNSIGNNLFTINDIAAPRGIGWTDHSITGVKYAHLAGNVPGADIGYYFPGGTNLKGCRESRTANWNAICGNPAMSDTINHTNQFLTLWFDHGINPSIGTYGYVLLPGMSASQVSRYASNAQVLILKNDTFVQAVKETRLKITAANFWTDTDQAAGIISSNKKASVMTKETANDLEVCVADPTMANTGIITLTIDKSAIALISKDPSITIVHLSPSILLHIQVNGAKGNTFKAKFRTK